MAFVAFECTGQVYPKDQNVHSERPQISPLEMMRAGGSGKKHILAGYEAWI